MSGVQATVSERVYASSWSSLVEGRLCSKRTILGMPTTRVASAVSRCTLTKQGTKSAPLSYSHWPETMKPTTITLLFTRPSTAIMLKLWQKDDASGDATSVGTQACTCTYTCDSRIKKQAQISRAFSRCTGVTLRHCRFPRYFHVKDIRGENFDARVDMIVIASRQGIRSTLPSVVSCQDCFSYIACRIFTLICG